MADNQNNRHSTTSGSPRQKLMSTITNTAHRIETIFEWVRNGITSLCLCHSPLPLKHYLLLEMPAPRTSCQSRTHKWTPRAMLLFSIACPTLSAASHWAAPCNDHCWDETGRDHFYSAVYHNKSSIHYSAPNAAGWEGSHFWIYLDISSLHTKPWQPCN